MVDAVKVEEIVKIVNDNFILNTETDWVAIFALVISIITLIWQWQDRKKDIQLQQWNALYPYRLDFITNFYAELFKFTEYKREIESNSIKIPAKDLLDFAVLFNRFNEEAKVLFPQDIQEEVRTVYKIIDDFAKNPNSVDKDSADYILTVGPRNSASIQDLREIQQRVKFLKLDDVLRRKFLKCLNVEGNKDE